MQYGRPKLNVLFWVEHPVSKFITNHQSNSLHLEHENKCCGNIFIRIIKPDETCGSCVCNKNVYYCVDWVPCHGLTMGCNHHSFHRRRNFTRDYHNTPKYRPPFTRKSITILFLVQIDPNFANVQINSVSDQPLVSFFKYPVLTKIQCFKYKKYLKST